MKENLIANFGDNLVITLLERLQHLRVVWRIRWNTASGTCISWHSDKSKKINQNSHISSCVNSIEVQLLMDGNKDRIIVWDHMKYNTLIYISAFMHEWDRFCYNIRRYLSTDTSA